MCKGGADDNQEQGSTEVFCGSVKSFNSRRGFGFLSCEETAARFGRDVYLSKDEAMMLAAEPEVGHAAADEKNKAPPPVQEGDVLLFQVKLSTEGFPQAVQVKKMRRLRGIVQRAPSSASDGVIIVTGDGSDHTEAPPQSPDVTLQQLLGAEVRLRQAECGQLRILPNDEIAFCCVSSTESGNHAWEAQLIDLISTTRSAGSEMGCFSLKLPQLRSKATSQDGESSVAFTIVELQGHAVTDCIFLSKVPCDLCTTDLMRLFSQLGGQEAKVTLGNGRSTLGYASVSFNAAENIAKFLVHSSHTVSESGVTQLASVGPGSAEYYRDGGMDTRHLPSVGHNNLNVASEETVHAVEPVCAQPLNLEVCTPAPNVSMGFPEPAPVPQVQPSMCVPTPLMTGGATWRCAHRNIVVPPAAPEMLAIGENFCSLCIQWPTIVHATAYVVELTNQNNLTSQRYLHPMPDGVLPFVMDLRVDNMQPGSYAANVRCIAPCGCESTCSPWSFGAVGTLVPPAAPALHLLQPATAPSIVPAVIPSVAPQGVVPHACPPPPNAPPTLPVTATVPDSSGLPPIPEESLEAAGVGSDEILTLD